MIVFKIDQYSKCIQIEPLDINNIIAYQLISSKIVVEPNNEDKEFSVSSGFTNFAYKPIINDDEQDVFPIMNYAILDQLKTKNIITRRTTEKCEYHFIPKYINNYSTINQINNAAVFVPQTLYDRARKVIDENLYDTKASLIKNLKIPSNVITINLDTILSNYKYNYNTSVSSPFLVLQVNANKEFKIKIQSVFEVIQYELNNELGLNIKADKVWSDIFSKVTMVLRNLYYMKIEQIIKLFYLNQSVLTEPISEKSKRELQQIMNDTESRNEVMSILIALYKTY
jgi:hypothetical protein